MQFTILSPHVNFEAEILGSIYLMGCLHFTSYGKMRRQFMRASVFYYLVLLRSGKALISDVTYIRSCSVQTVQCLHSMAVMWTTRDHFPRVFRLCKPLFLHADWYIKGTIVVVYRNLSSSCCNCKFTYLFDVVINSSISHVAVNWIPVSNIGSCASYHADIYRIFCRSLRGCNLFLFTCFTMHCSLPILECEFELLTAKAWCYKDIRA